MINLFDLILPLNIGLIIGICIMYLFMKPKNEEKGYVLLNVVNEPDLENQPITFSFVCRETVSFKEAGITDKNISIIYRMNGQVKSFIPGRMLANFPPNLEIGITYYIVCKKHIPELEKYIKNKSQH